jgi:hypothetical protein
MSNLHLAGDIGLLAKPGGIRSGAPIRQTRERVFATGFSYIRPSRHFDRNIYSAKICSLGKLRTGGNRSFRQTGLDVPAGQFAARHADISGIGTALRPSRHPASISLSHTWAKPQMADSNRN